MSITSTLVQRAEIRFHEAADVLRPYVGCFWVITAERDATLRIVPDGSTAISIELQGRPSEWSLRGPLVRPEERRFTSAATLVGVRLRPRDALGVIVGLAVWIAIASVAGLTMRSEWPEYASVADAMTFTLPMMFARLTIGACETLGAGWVAAVIARRSMLATVRRVCCWSSCSCPNTSCSGTGFPSGIT